MSAKKHCTNSRLHLHKFPWFRKVKSAYCFFFNNQPQIVMTVKTSAFLIITETWLLASVEIKAKHQFTGKILQTLEFCAIFTTLDYTKINFFFNESKKKNEAKDYIRKYVYCKHLKKTNKNINLFI